MITEIINFLSLNLGIDPLFIILIIFVIYFLPSFIEPFYKKSSGSLIFWNFFFGRTPLPRILLILNIIETNNRNEEILKRIENIEEKLRCKTGEEFIDFNNSKENSER